ncbi:hypothetical protein [Mycoplasma nasistruthionis]|uniref:Uncharacterized protein n=1 Tax=Mycoplasma nasistruthionis TaxID=353852 RepID=A0A5B7XVV2_9MOLU|nr:hypothetical protein [Mycoplasma nasistruthionis]QCZ36624.1 hypothetical protein FG904_01145 [Mycoplasma nasistruthionis]
MEQNTNKPVVDLIEMRKQEIASEQIKAKYLRDKQAKALEQKNLPWYQKDLTRNLVGVSVSVLVMIAIFLLARINWA